MDASPEPQPITPKSLQEAIDFGPDGPRVFVEALPCPASGMIPPSMLQRATTTQTRWRNAPPCFRPYADPDRTPVLVVWSHQSAEHLIWQHQLANSELCASRHVVDATVFYIFYERTSVNPF